MRPLRRREEEEEQSSRNSAQREPIHFLLYTACDINELVLLDLDSCLGSWEGRSTEGREGGG